MITSPSNPRIKEIRLLRQAKHRKARGEYFIEGVRLLEEALGAGLPLRQVVHSPRLEENPRGASLLSLAKEKAPGADFLAVSDEVLGSLGDAQTHQGVLAVLEKRAWSWEPLLRREGLVLLLCDLQDPGNLGTVFRAAEAGGAAGLVLTRGTTDPYGPKAVRASMGSLFRLPFLEEQDPQECLRVLRSRGRLVWAAAMEGGTSLWEADLARPGAVLLGQEGSGLSRELIAAADRVLTVPMSPGVNSLNVALAAGLVVYEAWRQRRRG